MLSACAHCHHFWWDWRMGHAFFQTVYKILFTIQHTLVAYSLSSWCILGSQHFHRVSRLVSFLWLLVSILISHLCSCFPVLGQKILLVSHLCLHLFPDWWLPSIISGNFLSRWLSQSCSYCIPLYFLWNLRLSAWAWRRDHRCNSLTCFEACSTSSISYPHTDGWGMASLLMTAARAKPFWSIFDPFSTIAPAVWILLSKLKWCALLAWSAHKLVFWWGPFGSWFGGWGRFVLAMSHENVVKICEDLSVKPFGWWSLLNVNSQWPIWPIWSFIYLFKLCCFLLRHCR